MSTCEMCGVRLDAAGRELPLSGPELAGEVHGVERCVAVDRLRSTVSARFGDCWLVWVEPRPGALRVVVSRRAGGARRVTAVLLVPDRLAVGVSQARGLYVAEETARQLEVQLAEVAGAHNDGC